MNAALFEALARLDEHFDRLLREGHLRDAERTVLANRIERAAGRSALLRGGVK